MALRVSAGDVLNLHIPKMHWKGEIVAEKQKLWQRKARGAGALSYRDQEPGTELAVGMPELERFSQHEQ